MVKVITGPKGTGKTKQMVRMANDMIETSHGSIVFINKDQRLMYDLKYQIRVVCMEEYPQITNIDEYIGFIFGIISSDHDIEAIFIDSILKFANIDIEDLKDFLDRLKGISMEHDLDFYVSISATREDLGKAIDGCEILN
ncbi:MAG: hypothetical protein ACOX4U_05305 [Anaerovoracaceae bacterium]